MSGRKVSSVLRARWSALFETPIVSNRCHSLMTLSSIRVPVSDLSSKSFYLSPPNLVSYFHTSVRDFRREEQTSDDKIRLVPSKKEYNPVDLETSQAYLRSDAFRQTYGDLPVWHPTLYR